MTRVSRHLVFVVSVLLCFGCSGCLFRTRTVEVRRSTANLMTATQEQLIEIINRNAAAVKSLNATVNIDTSVGGQQKGKVTEYQQISGYVLVRRPQMLRMIGLFPLVRNKAFDMVSDGTEFKLSIPVKNRFYTGHNDVVQPGGTALEHIRPQHLYDALLLHEIDANNEIAVMESSTETVVDKKTRQLVEQPDYVIDVIRKADDRWFLYRKIIFDRTNLMPTRQIVYDKMGKIATEAHYQAFKDFGGITFPTVIQISRPQEEYEIQLTIVKLTLNETLSDEQFALQQPPGSQLIDLDHPNDNASSGTGPATNTQRPAETPSGATPQNNTSPRL